MKTKDLMLMKTTKLNNEGDNIIHSRYGLCELREIAMTFFGEFFGAILRPKTKEGKILLGHDSQTEIPDFLEDSVGRLRMPNK